MKTNSKEVRQKILEHINETFNDLDYEECLTTKQKVRSQIDYMRNKKDSIYRTCERLVEGGTFLIYTSDIETFLNSLNLNNNSHKKFNDIEIFNMYKLLLSRELENLYIGIE